ncbi:c-type cytochrome domain-containing protein [Anatilimnocola floriformis]|uniref:c-type cytochrome domain-containing protein n=1 Tax=Anatilimnocola floriformis TaxID=2948575 RepID=UPI0020C39D80|nr:c-type cytochrome domain-containing protein [Anatilimnocola floriformis]
MSNCRWLFGLVVGCGLLLAGWIADAQAAPTAEQRAEVTAISTLMTKAANLFQNSKFKESAAAIAEVQQRIEKLAESGDEQVINLLAPIHKKLQNAHSLLELEGVTLTELKPLAKPMKPDPKDPKAGPGAPAGTPAAGGGVSFTKQVVPILTARCGGCHVTKSSGMFSMATYNALMKGSAAGLVIFKGDGKGSVLMEKIDDAEMPPNGQKIPAPEIEILRKWINEGAKFDGADMASNITMLTTAGTPAPAATPAKAPVVAQATGKETVSFSKELAPILAETCMGCHGTQQPRENFSVSNFERLLKGGDAGQNILPGKPAESLLIKKLKGTAADGQRMPLNQPALDNAVIAKFEKWIEEGAKFDGPDSKQSMDRLAAVTKAINSTHEELSNERAKLAMQHFALTLPNDSAERRETTNYLMLGNVGTSTLDEIGKQAERLAPRVADIFKAPADKPLIKGRLSLLIFKDRYSYSEFGKMVEKRTIPAQWRGHFMFDTVDAYAAVTVPRPGTAQDYPIQGMILQQLAGTYMASIGKNVPHWFAEGAGRVVASRLSANDPRVRAWDESIPAVVSSMPASDSFLGNDMDQEAADIAAYSYVKHLMGDTRRFQILVDGLRKGGDFNQLFNDVYGGSPAAVTQGWVRKAANSKPGPSRTAPVPKKNDK